MYTVVLEAGEAVCKQGTQVQHVTVSSSGTQVIRASSSSRAGAGECFVVESSSSFAAGTTILVSKIRCSSAHSAV
jgi:hypothetical protein